MNKINLKFDKPLVGNQYGKEIYRTQVKEKMNLNDLNNLVFPSSVKNISISFVKGFTEELLKELSYEGFLNTFKIVGNGRLKNKFLMILG